MTPIEPRATVDRCPACRSAGREIVEADVPDYRYGMGGAWSFVACTACSLVYLADPLQNARAAYPSRYSQHRPASPALPDENGSLKGELRARFLADRGYRSHVASRPRSLLASLPLALPPISVLAGYGSLIFPKAVRGGRLLDVGCGNGRFLRLMATLGWDVHGIEPDPTSAEAARRFSGATVYPDLLTAPIPPASFDVITMNHVLEHIAEPVEALAACHRMCRSRGTIAIAVPNWDSLGHRVFRRAWYSLDAPRHLVMWRRVTLTRELERAGFAVVRSRTTSAREWAITFRASWRYRTGASPSRALLAAWGVLNVLASIIRGDAGEELLVCAVKT